MSSPPENALYAAIMVELRRKFYVTDWSERGGIDYPNDDAIGFAIVTRNMKVDRYKVDVAVTLESGYPTQRKVTLAVECDGHDWHERTKQQASSDRARDRDLMRAGVFVIRFTGSDIFHDAERCAFEAVECAVSLWKTFQQHGEECIRFEMQCAVRRSPDPRPGDLQGLLY